MVPNAMMVEVGYAYTAGSAVFGPSRLLHVAGPALIALAVHDVVVLGAVLGHVVLLVGGIDLAGGCDAHFVVGVEADGKQDVDHHNVNATD